MLHFHKFFNGKFIKGQKLSISFNNSIQISATLKFERYSSEVFRTALSVSAKKDHQADVSVVTPPMNLSICESIWK